MSFLDFLFGYKPKQTLDAREIRGGEIPYSAPEPISPVVAKVLAMLEAEDYTTSYSYGIKYHFAKEESLMATLHRKHLIFGEFYEADERDQRRLELSVAAHYIDLNGAEIAALKSFFTKKDEAAAAAVEADRKAAIAKIEAYKVVNRKATT